jgi:hypothetical protein
MSVQSDCTARSPTSAPDEPGIDSTVETAVGSTTESASDACDDLLICKKTGKTMTWDQAECPNKGESCSYRAECQIQVVMDEMKDHGRSDAQRNDP